MNGSSLASWARPAVWTIAACCCLSLSACSGTPTATRPDAATTKAVPAATHKFCQQMDNLLDSLDSRGLTHGMTLTDARADFDNVLKVAIADFKRLEAQAPKSLKASVRHLVADFRAFKRRSDKASSVSELMADSTHGSPVQTPSYVRVLAYAGREC
jgi:hypothetical protein